MSSKKPELYHDDKGHPRGYRVGVSDGVYGVCPFCGKAYTEEDIKDSNIINFEHIFSRFGMKTAIDEKNVFSEIESEFMVAVHKSCNDKGSKELEKQVSRIINNFNKERVQLTKRDAQFLINYCIKISVFLRYLFLWDKTERALCVDKETINTKLDSEHSFGLKFYKDFHIRIKHVDSSAGLYWGLNEVDNAGNYCFTIVINDIEISYFYYGLGYKYENKKAIFIVPFAERIILLSGDEYEDPVVYRYLSRKRLPWKVEKDFSLFGNRYENRIETLSDAYDDTFDVPKNYFIRQNKLAKIGAKSEDKEKDKKVPLLDRNIVFCRSGQFLFFDIDGVLQNLSELPKDTEIPVICFKADDIPSLPNISQLKIMGDFVIVNGGLKSLMGAPKYVNGRVYIRHNNLTSLQYGPKYVGTFYNCDFNQLTSLTGAPEEINRAFTCSHNKLRSLKCAPSKVGDYFDCSYNELTSLTGAPKEIGGFFTCCGNKIKTFNCADTKINGTMYFDAEYLKSLDALPRAPKYIVVDCHKEFDTADELRAWFTEYKKQRDGKKKTAGLRAGAKRVCALDEIQKTKRKTKPDNQKKK